MPARTAGAAGEVNIEHRARPLAMGEDRLTRPKEIFECTDEMVVCVLNVAPAFALSVMRYLGAQVAHG